MEDFHGCSARANPELSSGFDVLTVGIPIKPRVFVEWGTLLGSMPGGKPQPESKP
jgi:hypothetical protein